MATSFHCNVSVSAHPASGQLGISIGPLDMGNLNEMLDYLASPECREAVMEAATRALVGHDFTPVPTVHFRAKTATVCGLDLWTTDEHAQRLPAVASIGLSGHPQHPITCPERLEWLKAHPEW